MDKYPESVVSGVRCDSILEASVLLLLLMDVPFQVLLVSPVILWFTAAPRWHPLIIGGGGLFWGALAWLIWRRMARSWAQDRAERSPQGDWRWPPSVSAEQFDAECRLFLRNHGWRAVQTVKLLPELVTLRAQKDRVHVLLHCCRGRAVPTEADIAEASAHRVQQSCTSACLVTGRRADQARRARARASGVELIRFEDIRFLDRFAG
jgi:hypothetical protein